MITLNLINQTEDIAAADVVICQHNADAGLRCNPVAWRVFRGITADAPQQFELPQAFEIAFAAGEGAVSAPQAARPGQAYSVVTGTNGPRLAEGHRGAEHKDSVFVPNTLEDGMIHASAYKDGRMVALLTDVAPGSTAGFRFLEHVYIGLVTRVQEGDVISEAAASRITARINLFGVRSADIVLSSTAEGPRYPEFRLENIQC